MLYKTSAYDYKHETPVKTLEGVVSFQIERIDGERYKRDLFIEQLEEDKKRLSAQAEAAGKRLEELQQRGLGKVIRDAERRDSGAYNWKTRKDFAGSVREKYPIYNGCSDEQLYQHITKLFPEYIEQIEENFK